jgi:hypothetical protein
MELAPRGVAYTL